MAMVWPWVAQLGQDRGGFYSFEVLEDLVGGEMENLDRIHPELQQWEVGDKLWMYPSRKAGGQGNALLVSFEPGRVLGFATRQVGTSPSAPRNGSWSFILEPVDEHTTRLLIRGRAGGGRALLGLTFDHFIFEPIHFVMERRMMEGIKVRAEGGHVSEAADIAHVVLWTVTFLSFIASAVLVFRNTSWIQPLASFVAAAAVFQFLTLGQPALALAIPLVIGLVAFVWLPSRQLRARSGKSSSSRTALAGCG